MFKWYSEPHKIGFRMLESKYKLSVRVTWRFLNKLYRQSLLKTTEPSSFFWTILFGEQGRKRDKIPFGDRNLLEKMTFADTCSLSKKVESVESVLGLNWTFRNFSAEPLWVKSASWFFSFIAYLITSVDFRMLDDTSMQVRSDFTPNRIIRPNRLYF